MSNALMAKFNMKGAKGEKVGFTKKTVYTAIKGVCFFFLFTLHYSEYLSRHATFPIWTGIPARANLKAN